MTKRSLADLAAAFDSKASHSGGGDQNWKKFFSFWKAPVDSVSTVRFLPDKNENNEMGFLVENKSHELTINGKRETVPCLKMYGKECPVCALSAKYYDEKSPEHNKTLGKKYYRKLSYIGQVLVIDTPIERDASQIVSLVQFGPQVYKQIAAGFASGDLEEAPYELKGGHNFCFRKTQTGDGQNSYITSTFRAKQTNVEDDIVEQLPELLYDLSEYRTPDMEATVIEAMLVADQTGSTFGGHDDHNDDTPVERPLRTAASNVEKEQQEVNDTPKAPSGEKKMSVVEQLKARAAAKASEAARAATEAE